ncbi:snRNA-activating protein complex subunit 1 [Caenorhabditis elegans]|uniref:snRNA-activating protein complex subunit 1 n=1 Tax=Caenorhabditis elegans TaxID=6239 RepID=Q17694_CAEEL|nr:snRNA-activating protein complex subunit 1 [Caenorhabditis elegans]CCD61460.1 snRNA-activating protein complex subunit 1 [Caenorhabditis elegans]|eukprot:NP_495636.2 SNAPc (Small Nuclear RNA Activating Complex) homolog [Caenorhabditis elegans]
MASGGIPTPFMGTGVKQDLHLLCNKFISMGSNRIRDFADVFRDMHFETILHYRLNPAECLEFTEYLLQHAAMYFGKVNEVGAFRAFKERLFGVYVCYALYNLQPVDHVCQIPVTAVQFEELLEFQKSLEVEKLLEPIAALKMLILKKAFRIKVFQSTYDPATHKKYLAEEELPYFNKIPVEPFSSVTKMLSSDIMTELSFIHGVYTEAKQKLGLSDTLTGLKSPLHEIKGIVEKYKEQFESSPTNPEISSAPEETAGSSRSTLRSKAYAEGLKHTRQRRHLDPNMEENFKHLTARTFGDIAQECLDDNDAQVPIPIDRPVRQRRRRKTTTVNPEELLDDNALAEEVLRNEYAARIKPEIPEDSLGGKVGKQGTSGVARIRAPKRANAKLVEVKREQIPQTSAPITASQIDESFTSPANKKNRKSASVVEVKPRISDEWANKLHAWHGQVEATDKHLKKLTSQIKLEVIEDEET